MSESKPINLSPLNPISKVVLALTFTIIAVEVVLQLAEAGLIGGSEGIGWRLKAVQYFGFHDSVFEYITQNRVVQPNVVWPFFTYPFVPTSIGRVAIGAAMVLAMGKTISESFSSTAVVVIFLVCSISGAIVFGLVNDGGRPLTGIFPVMYGFIAVYTWILADELYKAGKSMMPAFRIVAMFFAFRGVFALIFGLRNSWTADLTGLIVGFLLPFILAPDARARISRWIAAIRSR